MTLRITEKIQDAKDRRKADPGDKSIQQNRGRLAKAALAATIALTAGIAAINYEGNEPAPSDDTIENTVPTKGTVVAIPTENQGYAALVSEEADKSGVELSGKQLAYVVGQAEDLNPSQYGERDENLEIIRDELGNPVNPTPLQPEIGVPIYLPNISGPDGVDLTPPQLQKG
jgi:hypothetical protein